MTYYLIYEAWGWIPLALITATGVVVAIEKCRRAV